MSACGARSSCGGAWERRAGARARGEGPGGAGGKSGLSRSLALSPRSLRHARRQPPRAWAARPPPRSAGAPGVAHTGGGGGGRWGRGGGAHNRGADPTPKKGGPPGPPPPPGPPAARRARSPARASHHHTAPPAGRGRAPGRGPHRPPRALEGELMRLASHWGGAEVAEGGGQGAPHRAGPKGRAAGARWKARPTKKKKKRPAREACRIRGVAPPAPPTPLRHAPNPADGCPPPLTLLSRRLESLTWPAPVVVVAMRETAPAACGGAGLGRPGWPGAAPGAAGSVFFWWWRREKRCRKERPGMLGA